MTGRPPPTGTRLALGIASALAAGLMWGLVFVAPVMLPDYPAWSLTVGRYLAFGLIAAVLGLAQRPALARLRRDDWLEAARLAFIGNLAYYGCLAAAIQLAGAPLPTMIIGTLPVVIAVFSNLEDRALRWRRLMPSLVVLTAGIALVNQAELARLQAIGGDTTRHLFGALLAIGALVCWTWYPMRNARWMRVHPHVSPGTWSTAQGLATLPLALGGWLVAGLWYLPQPEAAAVGGFDFPFGPRPALFIGLMFAMGLTASWLGTLLWNRASRLLPTTLVGQLIVFETLSALAYAFAWRGETPGVAAMGGIMLLVLGVMIGVRLFTRSPHGEGEGATRT